MTVAFSLLISPPGSDRSKSAFNLWCRIGSYRRCASSITVYEKPKSSGLAFEGKDSATVVVPDLLEHYRHVMANGKVDHESYRGWFDNEP